MALNKAADWRYPGHFIAGSDVEDASSEIRTIFDPATEEHVGHIPLGSQGVVDAAVDAARQALPGWSGLSLQERVDHLRQAQQRVVAQSRLLAEIDVLETGKPISLAAGLVAAAPRHIEEFIEESEEWLERELPGGHMQLQEPYGVVAVVVPWNAPVEIVMRTLPAILLAGNTAVIKPSERAPLAVRHLVKIMDLPDGVVNVVLGDSRAGVPLVAHVNVDLVVHTGSVQSGRAIAAQCGRMLRPCLLELGGKDALIVDEGVDLGWAADVVATGAFINSGQLCTAIERVFVVGLAFEPFLHALEARVESEVVGRGIDPATTLGPLIDEDQRSIVEAHVADAIARGARALTGGRRIPGPGYFFEPTVLVDVDPSMEVMRAETFGPIAPVMAVDSLDEAVRMTNDTEFGLGATILTKRPEGFAAARRLRAGRVWVNSYLNDTPGSRTQPRGVSGVGVVGDRRAVLDAVVTPKTVHQVRRE